MSQSWDHVPAWAAEFPNDNPALHEGVSWVCLAVCGPVKPIARPRSATRPLGSLAYVPPAHPTSAVVNPSPVASVAPVENSVVLHDALAVTESEPHDGSLSMTWPEGSLPDLGEPVDEAGSASQALEATSASAALETAIADPATETVPLDPALEERLPESVLGVLLERLDLEFTPTSGSIALSNEPLDLLDIDASDLDEDAPTPTSENQVSSLEPFVFDGGIDSGAPEKASESAEEVVGSALEQRETSESVATSLDGASIPGDPPRLDDSAPPEPSKAEAFRAFVAALVEVLLVSGATRAAAVVPALLESAAGDPGALDPESQRLLVAARIADDTDGRIRLSRSFLQTAQAWRDVLSGETNDLSACGTSTLDGWAADLLKALGVGRDGKMDVRRELRRRGVAAFGMLLAA